MSSTISDPIWVGAGISVAIFIFLSWIRIAKQWDRAVILRLGKFARVSGPGLFIKLPFIETITEIVNVQILVTEIQAEEALTKDTVPVTVRAVMFWKVMNPKDAVVEVRDYKRSLQLAAQTTLRSAIGTHDFTDLLSKRDSVDKAIQETIEAKATAWGLEVLSIEIQDIDIPAELKDAMSREAQAEREQHARVILGQSEIEIAKKFVQASEIYGEDANAMKLREMNIIYETTKERGSTILLPTSLVDALSSSINKRAK